MSFRFPWRTGAMLRSEIEREIAFHLDARSAELEAAGMSPAEARRQAVTEFGDVAATRRYCLSQDRAAEQRLRWSERLADLGRGLRLAARRIRRRPGLVLTASVTLALGVGAATALWTIVHQVVLHPIPFRDSDRIVVLSLERRESQLQLTPSLAVAEFWRKQAKSFEGLEPVVSGRAVQAREDGATLVETRMVTDRFFDFTGLRPILGRPFGPGDIIPGAPPVALLGRAFWKREFGGDPSITGRTITLDNSRYTIVGVLPAELDRFPGSWSGEPTQVVLPLRNDARGDLNAMTFARLRPGVTLEAARSELAVLDPRLAALEVYPGVHMVANFTGKVEGGRDLLGQRTVRTLLVLLGSVGVLLLIACANVAHLLLGRVLSRRTEHAVRAALGASRMDLLHHGLADALFIGLLGGAAGLAISIPMLRLLVANRPPAFVSLAAVHPEPAAALVAGGLGLLVTLLAGILPAWRTARAAPGALLHGVWDTGRHEARRLRELLLLTEVSLSLLLLVGAGLVTRSLWKLGQLDLGFQPEGVTAASIELPSWRFQTPEAAEAFLQNLETAVAARPGVLAATRASGVPPETGIEFGKLEIAGRTLREDEQESFFASQQVGPGYFLTMSLPILEGRAFDPRPGGEKDAVVVSRTFARRYWPGGGAAGHRMRVGEGEPWREIVGVATDVPALGLGEMRGALQIYRSLSGSDGTMILARTGMPAAAWEKELRTLVRTLDPDVPVKRVTTVPAMLRASTATERFTGVLLSGFAVFATLLFAAGLFGVLSHAVAMRTREIGVRVALGADPTGVRWLVVRQGLRPVLLGVLLGVGGAWAGGKVVGSLLYDITAHDLVTFIAAPVVTLAVALAASYLPAWRASRLDPVSSLRE